MPPEGSKISFKGTSNKFMVYDNGQWIDLDSVNLATVTFEPLTPWKHSHSYPLHVRLSLDEPEYHPNGGLLKPWEVPKLRVEIYPKGHSPDLGPVRVLFPASYVLQQPPGAASTRPQEESHVEFYDHNGQILLEMRVHAVEYSYKADWLHGEECLCPNKETLF